MGTNATPEWIAMCCSCKMSLCLTTGLGSKALHLIPFWMSEDRADGWSESHSVLSDSLRPHGLYSPWNSPGQNTGLGNRSLLQGIFPTKGLNPGLPHCRWILYQLSYQKSGWMLTNRQYFLNYFIWFVIIYYLISGSGYDVSGERESVYALADLKINGFEGIKQKKGSLGKQQAVEKAVSQTLA